MTVYVLYTNAFGEPPIVCDVYMDIVDAMRSVSDTKPGDWEYRDEYWGEGTPGLWVLKSNRDDEGYFIEAKEVIQPSFKLRHLANKMPGDEA